MKQNPFGLGFAGFVDNRGTIIIDDTVAGRQAPIPTGVLAKDNPILELNLVGRQAPIQTQERADFKKIELLTAGRQAPIQTQERADFKSIELITVGRQQAIIEAQKKLEAQILELNING